MDRDLLVLAREDSRAFEQALSGESDAQLTKLADKLTAEKSFAAAELVYRELCRRKPKDEDSHFSLARNLYYEQREGERAEEFLREAVRAFPKSALLASVRGTNLAWGLQRHADALEPFKRAVELDADDAGTRSCLAWCLLWLGETQAGLEQVQATLASNAEGDDDDEVSLVCQLYLYLCGDAAARREALVDIARFVAKGQTVDDWDVRGLVERARAQSHPEAAHLEQLVQVVFGRAHSRSLADWPAWRASRAPRKPDADDSLVEAVLKAVAPWGPNAIFDAACAANIQVSGPKHPFPDVPFQTAYAGADALMGAVEDYDTKATSVVIDALVHLEGDAQLELMSRLLWAKSPLLSRPAERMLIRSRDDRALAALMQAFEPEAPFGYYLLTQSAHPAARERVRAVLAAAKLHEFVPRPRPSVSEWQALSKEEQGRLSALSPKGPRPPAVQAAEKAISVLGMLADAGSLELFLAVFEAHPDDWLRAACAGALSHFDDARVVAAFQRACSDQDSKIGAGAVRYCVRRNPAGIWATFEPHITAALSDTATPSDLAIVYRMLSVVHGGSTPRKVAAERDPLLLEPRLYELAARWRDHPRFDTAAKPLLELLPRPELNALLARIKLAPKAAPKPPRIVLPKRRDFVARYAAGEFGVWDELVKLTPALLVHGDLYQEGAAVARLLMQRVRQNTDAVRATLTAAGATLQVEEAPAQDEDLERLTALVGPLPIALHALWTVCGSLQLMPQYVKGADPSYGDNELEAEGISLIALDPLAVDGPDIGWQLENYESELAETHEELMEPLIVSIAPDFLHKQNISGGSPYAIQLPPLPADAVDPDVLDEHHETSLVGYLRICFDYGGFPLLEVAKLPLDDISLNDRVAFENVKGSWVEPAERLLRKLRRDLVPF